jgi:hypothetical protein
MKTISNLSKLLIPKLLSEAVLPLPKLDLLIPKLFSEAVLPLPKLDLPNQHLRDWVLAPAFQ